MCFFSPTSHYPFFFSPLFPPYFFFLFNLFPTAATFSPSRPPPFLTQLAPPAPIVAAFKACSKLEMRSWKTNIMFCTFVNSNCIAAWDGPPSPPPPSAVSVASLDAAGGVGIKCAGISHVWS